MNVLTICEAAAIAEATTHGGVVFGIFLKQLRALKVGCGISAFICILVHGRYAIVDKGSIKTDRILVGLNGEAIR